MCVGKSSTSDKEDERHVQRRMLDAPERDGEEDRKPGGKILVKEIWTVWGYRSRTPWTEQSGRMIFDTISATQDDGKSPRRSRAE